MSDIRFNNWYHQSGTGGVYQDGSGNVGIGSSVPTSNLDVAGTVTATTFSGNLTGNVTGDITANSITVGDKFINSSGVGLGTTSTAGRNAGISTAIGTVIYNADTDQTEVYGYKGWVKVGGTDYIEATGGTITQLTEGKVTYNVHTFNGTENFEVLTANNPTFAEVQYLLVAGGGGGGGSRGNGNGAGGGGAGGHLVGSTQVSAGTYVVTIGAGGDGGAAGPTPGQTPGTNGQNSTISGPDIATITAVGGGYGASQYIPNGNPGQGNPGGSGGGNGAYNYSNPAGSGTDGQGYPGGFSVPAPPGHSNLTDYAGGGGGGAGQRGSDGTERQGTGGKGLYSSLDGTNTIRAGGGGGGKYSAGVSGMFGGAGGGGAGGGNNRNDGEAGTANTGGGGGGAAWPPTGTGYVGGNGGSGVAILRYVTSGQKSAAATGGSVSFYNGKTIHVFTGTGTFTTPATFNKTCEYVVVGGGGAGGPSGNQTSGGGGAGGYLTGTTSVSGANTITITVGAGGYHGESYDTATITNPGSHSIAAFPAGSVRSEGGGGGNGWAMDGTLMSGGSGGGSGNGSSPVNGGTGAGGTGNRVAGTNTPATPGQGNPGGDYSAGRGAGGGGAGATGQGPSAASDGGYGGIGVLLPATFTSPFVNVGHTGHAPGNHYVAGGGGGGGDPTGSGAYGATWDGSAAVGPGPWNAGAGRGGNGAEPHATINSDGYMDAKASTGSGGGGNYDGGRSGSGGSGVVLIAYPS